MKIGVIGLGHVGRSMTKMLQRHAEIVSYDIASDQSYPESELAECAFAVVCVSTPMAADGRCDVAGVKEAVLKLPTERILIKSTVAPGTTEHLAEITGKQICFSPEYFGESSYESRFLAAGPTNIPFVILGGNRETTAAFAETLTPIMGPDKIYFQCTAIEAEIIKYMENSYLALKVTFVNEFYEICRAYEADWTAVREGWLLDPHVERDHTAVFADNRGFGGRCLPKDVSAIVWSARSRGCEPKLLEAMIERNSEFRSRNT